MGIQYVGDQNAIWKAPYKIMFLRKKRPYIQKNKTKKSLRKIAKLQRFFKQVQQDGHRLAYNDVRRTNSVPLFTTPL